jgi:Cu/Ag efflux pump CusA
VRISDKTQLDNTPVASSTNTDGTTIPNACWATSPRQTRCRAVRLEPVNIQAVYDVHGSVEHRDLGSVAADIQKIVDAVSPQLKPGNHIVVRRSKMHSAFGNLTIGLFAAVFVYMLMVSTIRVPRSACASIGAAGCGRRHPADAVRTGTTISVPSREDPSWRSASPPQSSILLVTFAREVAPDGHERLPGHPLAGTTRLRPVLMTAAAMIVGMTPMAIGGPGEGTKCPCSPAR